MVRLSSRKAKKILDFLARRAGYEKSSLIPNWHNNGMSNLFFCQGQCANAYETIEEVLIHGDDEGFEILGFHNDINEKDVLEYLLKNKHKISVVMGPLAKNYSWTEIWIKVFLENDSLESLAIEADLVE